MSRLSAALSSATQHAMPPESGRLWGTECLNTRFPLPTLLCGGYSVKLIYLFNFICYRKLQIESEEHSFESSKYKKVIRESRLIFGNNGPGKCLVPKSSHRLNIVGILG